MHRFRTLELFAGIGGGILGGLLLGHTCVGAVEINAYCQQILSARQADGSLPWFPIFADIKSFDGRRYRGLVDIVSGGFPCQDISVAGKGAGITGERSGLWKEMLRVIREVRPPFAFVENVPALLSRGVDTVLGDLAEIGYDAEWCVLGADDVGANHHRKRIWILAYTNGGGRESRGTECEGQERSVASFGSSEIPDSSISRRWTTTREPFEGQEEKKDIESECLREDVSDTETSGLSITRYESEQQQISTKIRTEFGSWWQVEPDVGRVVAGCPSRVDRLKGLGNAQVPYQMATAFRILWDRMIDQRGQ